MCWACIYVSIYQIHYNNHGAPLGLFLSTFLWLVFSLNLNSLYILAPKEQTSHHQKYFKNITINWRSWSKEELMSTFTSTDLCKWHSRLFVKPPGLFRHVSSSTLKCQQGFRTNHALLPLTIGQRSSLSNQPCRKNKIVCNSFPLPGVPGPSHSW